MILIKNNIQKKRQTWKSENFYRKVWLICDPIWLDFHVDLLNKVIPGYVVNHDFNDTSMWIDYKIIKGIPASNFDHTDAFIRKIYNFCLDNIQQTFPYAHGDWVLSNIMIDDDQIAMCDWDNLNIYPIDEVIRKLHRDMISAFGEKFKKILIDDTTGI
jgi:RIO-like serine/threonine protein kinase